MRASEADSDLVNAEQLKGRLAVARGEDAPFEQRRNVSNALGRGAW